MLNKEPVLRADQVERIRFSGERTYAAQLTELLGKLDPITPPKGARVRRNLMTRSLLLSEGMSPKAYSAARACAKAFGIDTAVEIYQAAGTENAAMHFCSDPVLLEIQGRLLALLDDEGLQCVMGHELGHFLAHGETNPECVASLAARHLLYSETAPDSWVEVSRRLSMAAEITADRFGLLAAGSLDGALRLSMVVVTGLPSTELNWDTEAYLEQSKALVDYMRKEGETAEGTSHPEHGLRAWAQWLFSETDVYQELTGAGPGTRRLEDVDREILEMLGTPHIQLDDAQAFEEPLPEVQECALAACVLVAHADGEVHETEIAAIERVFEHLVPGWRELLHRETAYERFRELAPLLYASGPRAQRSLFMLLFHVVAADGEIATEEIGAVLTIGDALGCSGLFHRFLRSVVGNEAVAAADQVATREVIPLAAEAKQVDHALRVFFQRARKQGGRDVTARRLLRLTGQKRFTHSVRRDLHAAATDAGIVIEPPLSEDLEATHRLVCQKQEPASPDRKVAVDVSEATQRLIGTVSKLRDKLVSGDGRSPSVRLRDVRRGRAFDCHQLEGISVGLAERIVELVRGEQKATLVESEQAMEHEAAARAQRQLIDLHREHLSRMEETGADELFLGTTFISATLSRYLLRAPLILHNVAIKRTAASISLITPREDSAMANQALLQTMARLTKKPWTEALAAQADEAARQGQAGMLEFMHSQGFKLVGELDELLPFRNRNDEFDDWLDDRIELENCAVLGLFPQSRSDLLHDYDGLIDELSSSKPAAPLLSSAVNLLPKELKSLVAKPNQESAPDIAAAPPKLPVIQADPVQRHVMAVAAAQHAMVVDGPPGTGKSQVIVNLICDALLEGKKVAVVCEKRAALDVVVNRMQAEGLRHLLALVHDVKEDRSDLYTQIADRIEAGNDPAPAASKALDSVSQELLDAARPLTEMRSPLLSEKSGVTLGQAMILARGIDLPDVAVPPALCELSKVTVEALSDQFAAMEPFAGLWSPESAWRSPTPDRVRSSLADASADDRREVKGRLESAVAARAAFDESRQSAQLPSGSTPLKTVLGLKEPLTAFLSLQSRSNAGQAEQVQALWALFTQRGTGSLVAYSRAVEQLERQLLAAGLPSDKATLQKLVQARPALIEMKQVSEQHEELLRSVSAWAHNTNHQALAQEHRACVAMWTQAEDALAEYTSRVKWKGSAEFSRAHDVVRQNLGRWQRVFSPAWWSARGVVRSQLQLQWKSAETVVLSASTLAKFEQFTEAARCWKVFDDLAALAALGDTVGTREQAQATLAALGKAQPVAERIAAAKPALSALSLWPVPASPPAWKAWGERIAAMLEVLPALGTLTQARRTISAEAPTLKLPATTEGMKAVKARAAPLLGMLRQRNALISLSAWPDGNAAAPALPQLTHAAHRLYKVITTFARLQNATAALQTHFPWVGAQTPLRSLVDMNDRWNIDFDDLVKADQLLEKATQTWPMSPQLLLALAAAHREDQAQWDAVVTGLWAKTVAAQLLSSQEHLTKSNRLLAEAEQEMASRLRNLHADSHAHVSAAVVASQNRSDWYREPPADKGARRTPIQSIKEAMLKEARKQRRIMPLRTFVRQYVDKGLLDALPVWLLSPETMAQLFPREPIFDLVIMDEASQCTVETGLPVLMRARKIVIAGDEHQMPPSNYFKASADTDSSDGESEVPLDVMDAESLLVLARDRCHHHRLAWHYRCQFEELIAFSNHAIYEGDLRTIPATQSRMAPAAICWHKVENASYDAGTNPEEAAAVVDLMYRLLKQKPEASVGVITFNLKQRRTILDAIDARMAEDAQFAEVYQRAATSDHLDQRPFVKNLENVQGDERDQIIFSLGHAPRQRQRKDGKGDWYVPARFGPLGQRGGERRLNVAASRAKQAIHIVASFEPSMLSVANAKHSGPRLFKGFLEYCQKIAEGRRSEAERVLDVLRGAQLKATGFATLPSPHFVPLKVQLLLALEAKGYTVELDVGDSEFRVDVAITDPKDPHRYALGLLCEEGQGELDPFEAHVHIPAVLSMRGWQLLRVNALDWGLRSEAVLKQVTRAVGRPEPVVQEQAAEAAV